jgi:hypothetical protein
VGFGVGVGVERRAQADGEVQVFAQAFVDGDVAEGLGDGVARDDAFAEVGRDLGLTQFGRPCQ